MLERDFFEYSSTGGGHYILKGVATGYPNSTLIIPSTWDDGSHGSYSVTIIGSYVLKQGSSSGTYVSGITSVTIPSSVTS